MRKRSKARGGILWRVSTPGTVAQRSRWPYVSLIPFGFGSWAPIYAGVKARERTWTALGLLWLAMIILALVLTSAHGHGNDGVVGALAVIAWIGGIATSFSIRGAYDRQMSSDLERATEAAEQRLADRRRALEMARRNPALATEVGIGRPDKRGAADAGLVDLNNAGVTALLTLPGMDGDLATLIIEAREKLNGFSSLEDCGAALDMDGGVVEGLRHRVVFLPRRA
jgi:DNA uptake protein ComE-like DNA-binding protein